MKTSRKHSKLRGGSTLAELIVAAGLLVTSLSLLATSSVAGFKLQRLEHHQAVATDELSNQLEKLLALSPQEVSNAIAAIQISQWASETLPEAELTASIEEDEFGKRVVLKLWWKRVGESTPVFAVGWINDLEVALPTRGDADES